MVYERETRQRLSGWPARGVRSVTVVAPTGLEADALSTAVFVLGLRRGLEMINGIAGVDCLLVGKDGRSHRTLGFPIVSVNRKAQS